MSCVPPSGRPTDRRRPAARARGGRRAAGSRRRRGAVRRHLRVHAADRGACASSAPARRRGADRPANLVFDAVIAEVDRYGGSVIYFSGDAITCWLDGDDGARGRRVRPGDAASDGAVGDVSSPPASRVALAMKVAVAVGPVRRFVVGDPEVQLIDVLAGRPDRRAGRGRAPAPSRARWCSTPRPRPLGGRVEVAERREDEATAGRPRSACSTELRAEPPTARRSPADALPEEAQSARGCCRPVYERLRRRPGRVPDRAAPGGRALPALRRHRLRRRRRGRHAARRLRPRRPADRWPSYDGTLLQLTIGDKGSYLYAAFGAPHRARGRRRAGRRRRARAAAPRPATAARRDLQIGISRGALRSGAYGGATRRTYGCLGDEVNLAARLMQAARRARSCVSAPRSRPPRDAFAWERAATRCRSRARRAGRRLRAASARASGRRIAAARAALRAADGRARRRAGGPDRARARAARWPARARRRHHRRGRHGQVAPGRRGRAAGARAARLASAAASASRTARTTAYLVWRPIWQGLLGVDPDLAPRGAGARARADARARSTRTLVAPLRRS